MVGTEAQYLQLIGWIESNSRDVFGPNFQNIQSEEDADERFETFLRNERSRLSAIGKPDTVMNGMRRFVEKESYKTVESPITRAIERGEVVEEQTVDVEERIQQLKVEQRIAAPEDKPVIAQDIAATIAEGITLARTPQERKNLLARLKRIEKEF